MYVIDIIVVVMIVVVVIGIVVIVIVVIVIVIVIIVVVVIVVIIIVGASSLLLRSFSSSCLFGVERYRVGTSEFCLGLLVGRLGVRNPPKSVPGLLRPEMARF